MSTKTYLLLYHKTIAKETAFSPINQPEKHHHGIFSHVGLRLGGGGLGHHHGHMYVADQWV
jgi:hypothetical protein